MLCPLSMALCLSLCDFKEWEITVFCCKTSLCSTKEPLCCFGLPFDAFLKWKRLVKSWKCLVGHPQTNAETCTSTQSGVSRFLSDTVMWNTGWLQVAAFPTLALRPLWRSLTHCMKDPNKAALSLLSGPASTHRCRDRPQPALFLWPWFTHKEAEQK